MAEERIVTVAMLIAALQSYPQDLPIVVDGYEGGFGSPEFPQLGYMRRDVNTAWYYGPHEEASIEAQNAVPMVMLRRADNHLADD